jgi:alkylated DNA repair protein alkB family protein 6
MNFVKLKAKLREERSAKLSGPTETSPKADESENEWEEESSFNRVLTIRSKQEYVVLDAEGLYYIPEAITEAEEERLLASIGRLPWTQLRTRKLQCYDGGALPAGELRRLANALSISTGLDLPIDINHILVNRYKPTEGILHHEDGPVYKPVVAILSMQETCIMTFRRKLTVGQCLEDAHSLVLRPRSLLLFCGAMYDAHLHGICPQPDASDTVESHCRNCKDANVAVGQVLERDCERTSITLRERLPELHSISS